jgi:hypothetical protein
VISLLKFESFAEMDLNAPARPRGTRHSKKKKKIEKTKVLTKGSSYCLGDEGPIERFVVLPGEIPAPRERLPQRRESGWRSR